jgi:phosphate starvation-inducible protein PhoH and related proteins
MLEAKFPGDFLVQLFGGKDDYSSFLEKSLKISISFRDDVLLIDGEEEGRKTCQKLVEQLFSLYNNEIKVRPQDLETAFLLYQEGFSDDFLAFYRDSKIQCYHNRTVFPKGLNQGRYIAAMKQSDCIFGIGPAGTGKTYLAVAMAVWALKEKRVKRIILTRPAVEAGEKLGFLPGDLAEKVNPYLRPLYDSLFDLMDVEKVHKLMEADIIEVAPIAFMRGRTLNDSFIILDEAQNTTREQMKMFLTRLGFNSKAVITGDVTQIDIEPSRKSGLVDAAEILSGIKGLAFIYFSHRDVVRHPLVQKIIRAYEDAPNNR